MPYKHWWAVWLTEKSEGTPGTEGGDDGKTPGGTDPQTGSGESDQWVSKW